VKTLTVRVPLENVLTEDTIDYMRAKKAAIRAQFDEAEHHG
jgi:hypothetical protein